MNTPGNARSTASKSAICRAMLELLNEKTPEKITVQELIKKADVNRSTFYAHYTDIGDLMEKIEIDMVAPMSVHLYAADATADRIFSEKALEELAAFFRSNRSFYRIFFATSSKSRLIRETAAYVKSRFVDPHLERARQFSQEEYALQFEFCMVGFFGVIRKWLDGECREPDDVLAHTLATLFWKCLG